MKNRIIIIFLTVFIFSCAHAVSYSCKAITLLMTYEEVSKALNGKIENCSKIDGILYPEANKKYLPNFNYNAYSSRVGSKFF